MPVIVKADGFHKDIWQYGDVLQDHAIVPWDVFVAHNQGNLDNVGVFVPNTLEAADVAPFFDRLQMIAIDFPSFADGRGFSRARRLRQAGFTGVIRAKGHVIADQFSYALECGFDEVEISDDQAARQPQDQWLVMKDALSLSYQSTFVPEGTSILERRKAGRLTV